MSSDQDRIRKEEAPLKPANKIRIIEDAEATGDTLAAYDSGAQARDVSRYRHHQVLRRRPDFLRQVVQFPTPCISPKVISPGGIKR